MSGEGMIAAALMREPVALRSPVLAVAKPREGKIALFVSSGGDQVGCCELSLDEAGRLHETLGSAIALMKRPGQLPAGKIDWRRALTGLLGFLVLALAGACFLLFALMSGGAG